VNWVSAAAILKKRRVAKMALAGAKQKVGPDGKPNGHYVWHIAAIPLASARRSLLLDSHQFIEESLVVVADAENVLLILLGQRAAML
jgi:hypothetical protein